MANDPTRTLVVELRRALIIAIKACDGYLVSTSQRPGRAQDTYGPDGDQGYIAEVDELKMIHSGRAGKRPTRA